MIKRMSLSFIRTSVETEDARTLLNELNDVLTGILGHSGTAHVCLDDFSREKAFFLVGYEEGVPVCCAGVRMLDEETGEVKRVYARKNRTGIGAALMAEVERQAGKEGYERLVLECREGNSHAIRFYQRTGYMLCRKYPPYENEADAVCLEKSLKPGGGQEPLLYRAARRGTFGTFRAFGQGCIADALFVYLDGRPETESVTAVEEAYTNRPLVCLTDDWERFITERYPGAAVYRRHMMKPAKEFMFPEQPPLPEGYRTAAMDEAAFRLHPFGHGMNYASYDDFRAEGSGTTTYNGDQIVACASSFLSLDGEVELDVFTAEEHRGKGLAAACVAGMLRDCMERGITVHWDAQNETSLHLAEKFGFEQEAEYDVYWLPEQKEKV